MMRALLSRIVQELSPLSLDRQKVKIVDISRNGLGILAPNAALPGTIMQVRINTVVELAEVRYCSAGDGNEYRIGLRFIAFSDESTEHFIVRRGAIVGDLPLEQRPDRRKTPRQRISQPAVVNCTWNGSGSSRRDARSQRGRHSDSSPRANSRYVAGKNRVCRPTPPRGGGVLPAGTSRVAAGH